MLAVKNIARLYLLFLFVFITPPTLHSLIKCIIKLHFKEFWSPFSPTSFQNLHPPSTKLGKLDRCLLCCFFSFAIDSLVNKTMVSGAEALV